MLPIHGFLGFLFHQLPIVHVERHPGTLQVQDVFDGTQAFQRNRHLNKVPMRSERQRVTLD